MSMNTISRGSKAGVVSKVLCKRLLFPSLHQRLAEVLLGVAVIWTALQGQFKVGYRLHDAAFVSIPTNIQ